MADIAEDYVNVEYFRAAHASNRRLSSRNYLYIGKKDAGGCLCIYENYILIVRINSRSTRRCGDEEGRASANAIAMATELGKQGPAGEHVAKTNRSCGPGSCIRSTPLLYLLLVASVY